MASSEKTSRDKYLRQVALSLAKDLPLEREDAQRVVVILSEIVDKVWESEVRPELRHLRGGLRD